MPTIIVPRVHDLGGFNVRRALPAPEARSVGPFVFADHMGPHVFAPGQAVDVRPHPHIGLATITWLWEGRFMHRDSLGCAQEIAPGLRSRRSMRSARSMSSPATSRSTAGRFPPAPSFCSTRAGRRSCAPAARHG
jgi:hypothetical protein